MDKLDELCEILAEKFINIESGPLDTKLQKMGRISQMVCCFNIILKIFKLQSN